MARQFARKICRGTEISFLDQSECEMSSDRILGAEKTQRLRIVKIVFNAEDAKVFAEGAEKGFPLRSVANASASLRLRESFG